MKGRNLKAGAEAAAMEGGRCSVACSTWPAQPAFLYNLGPPGQRQLQPQWAGLLPINHYLTKCPTGWPIA